MKKFVLLVFAAIITVSSVYYTHLAVYKRQERQACGGCKKGCVM